MLNVLIITILYYLLSSSIFALIIYCCLTSKSMKTALIRSGNANKNFILEECSNSDLIISSLELSTTPIIRWFFTFHLTKMIVLEKL